MLLTLKRWGWPVVAALLGFAFLGERHANADLRATNALLTENRELLEQLVDAKTQLTAGQANVNKLCANQLVDLMQRLGLDNEFMPLVSTLYWRRATGGLSIERARKRLGARTTAEGFLSDPPPTSSSGARTAPAEPAPRSLMAGPVPPP